MDSPVVDAEYRKEIDEARRDLQTLITNNKCAPIMLRLALLDAATYDAKTKTGGANGSIRNDKELNHTENNGLGKAIQLCDEVKKKHPKITYADLYQLAGVVAVEVIGGPPIDFVPGRKDSDTSPDEGRLPNENQGREHWRDIFSRMGLSDKEIVALCRALALGRAHIERSGNDGASTKELLKFDNSYFKELLNGKDEGLLKLPIDKALVDDRELSLYVEKYAKDEKAFFKDYAASHKKLSELGFKTGSSEEQVAPSSSTEHKVEAKNNTVLVQSAMIVAITVAVVVLGYLFEVHRRGR